MADVLRRLRSLRAGLLITCLVAGTVSASGTALGAQSHPDHLPDVVACDSAPGTARTFSDVPADHTHYGAISCIAAFGITVGYGDGTFRPANHVTRRQMALMLSRASRLVSDTFTIQGFQHPSDYDSEPPEVQAAIAVVLTRGIMDLRPDGSFSPDELVTRAEMAEMMIGLLLNNTRSGVRLGSSGTVWFDGEPNRSDDSFADAATEAVSAAYELGIIRGFRDGTFRPDLPVTRAHASAFITRALDHTPFLTVGEVRLPPDLQLPPDFEFPPEFILAPGVEFPPELKQP